MRSRIFVGEIMHLRLAPQEHLFHYPVYFYAIDLSELRNLPGVFGYNKVRPISIWDKDYLQGQGSIEEKIRRYLSSRGIEKEISRIELVTSARYFLYVFNPVSFFYCYDSCQQLRAVVSEINNTFGERHLYFLDALNQDEGSDCLRQTVPKEFHVSPFNDMNGDYDFYFSPIDKELDIRINILRDKRRSFLSSIRGKSIALTTMNLLKTIAKFPLTASLTMPRILWQAAVLHYKKKLEVFTKPIPTHPHTIQIKGPALRQRIARRFVCHFFSRLQRGSLQLDFPNGEKTIYFGNLDSEGPHAIIRIRDWKFFTRALWDGDIGFGESYTASEWDSPDLKSVIQLFIRNVDFLNDRDVKFSWPTRILNRIQYLRQKNTLKGSKKNIQFHYDLSNEFFQLFLDRSMTYSCALFESENEDLVLAQNRKIEKILELAKLSSENHVLEIGSGWGELAIQAARRTGCQITTLTLSERQKEFVEKRIQAEGLQGRIHVQLCDFRNIQGKFDKIISIEMLEAVGLKNLRVFFEKCDSLLKPEGLAVIQVITLPDRRFESVKRGTDWIQKHIFPGSLCPSLTALCNAMTASSHLMIESLQNIGPHYSRTLRLWRERFFMNRSKIEDLGFSQEFLRAWNYYLCYCEAGFESRYINDLQLVLTKPRNSSLGIPRVSLDLPDQGTLTQTAQTDPRKNAPDLQMFERS